MRPAAAAARPDARALPEPLLRLRGLALPDANRSASNLETFPQIGPFKGFDAQRKRASARPPAVPLAALEVTVEGAFTRPPEERKKAAVAALIGRADQMGTALVACATGGALGESGPGLAGLTVMQAACSDHTILCAMREVRVRRCRRHPCVTVRRVAGIVPLRWHPGRLPLGARRHPSRRARQSAGRSRGISGVGATAVRADARLPGGPQGRRHRR